jgi:hypothetical protein
VLACLLPVLGHEIPRGRQRRTSLRYALRWRTAATPRPMCS